MRDNNTVRPHEMSVPLEAITLLPRNIAEKYHVCPLAVSELRNGVRTLAVATADPANIVMLDQLQQISRCRIQAVPADLGDITKAINLHYSSELMDSPTDLLGQLGNLEPAPATYQQTEGAPNVVENILQKAVNERASDVHIEPHADDVYVRFRVDGVMYDHTSYAVTQHQQVVSRIKILAKLDIAQNRLAQDGHFEIAFGNRAFDIRVSILPAITGEKVVMRLLPKGPMAMDFEVLGIFGHVREMLEETTHLPFGMTLLTGPTGSGKTTTLYACMSKIDCLAKNVVTVEDPVEYQFPRITQLQVHPKIGLNFASGLRSILRQDPDVIVVGEIRDLETLQIAMQSALTGHTVFSTIHCNDAAAAAARMIDMGAEPYLIASSVNVIIAQRLLRRICENCRVEQPATDELKKVLNLPDDGAKYFIGKGCPQCRNTGYSGRIGVYEALPLHDSIRQAIVRKATASEIRNIMQAEGIITLMQDALDKAHQGIISLDEILRCVFIESAL